MTVHEIVIPEQKSKSELKKLFIDRLQSFIDRIEKEDDITDLAIAYTFDKASTAGTDIIFGSPNAAMLNIACDVTKAHIMDYFLYGIVDEEIE